MRMRIYVRKYSVQSVLKPYFSYFLFPKCNPKVQFALRKNHIGNPLFRTNIPISGSLCSLIHKYRCNSRYVLNR